MVKYYKIAWLLLVVLLLGGCENRSDLPSRQQLAMLHSQLIQGREDFLQGHYREAFKELLPPAQQCEPSAEYAIGYMYFYGKGIMTDIEMAQLWMRRAARHGYPLAPAALAKIDRVVAMQQQPFSLPVPNIRLDALEKKNKDYKGNEPINSADMRAYEDPF